MGDDLILPTFVEKLVNRLIEVHTEVEKLSKNQETRLDKDEKSNMMQRLLLQQDKELRSLLPMLDERHPRLRASSVAVAPDLANIRHSNTFSQVVDVLQEIKESPPQRITVIDISSSPLPECLLRILAAGTYTKSWEIKTQFSTEYPEVPPEFSLDGITINSMQLVEQWSRSGNSPDASHRLQDAILAVLETLDAAAVGLYPYTNNTQMQPPPPPDSMRESQAGGGLTSPSSWIKPDLARIGKEFSNTRRPSKMFSDSTDSEGDENELGKVPKLGGSARQPTVPAGPTAAARATGARRNSGSNLTGHFQTSKDAEAAMNRQAPARVAAPPKRLSNRQMLLQMQQEEAADARTPAASRVPAAAASRAPAAASGRAPVAAAPAAESTTELKTAEELLKMPYMKLKKYLVQIGMSKKDVDAHSGVPSMVILAKSHGMCK